MHFINNASCISYTFDGNTARVFASRYECDEQSALAVCISFVTGNTTERKLIAGYVQCEFVRCLRYYFVPWFS